MPYTAYMAFMAVIWHIKVCHAIYGIYGSNMAYKSICHIVAIYAIFLLYCHIIAILLPYVPYCCHCVAICAILLPFCCHMESYQNDRYQLWGRCGSPIFGHFLRKLLVSKYFFSVAEDITMIRLGRSKKSSISAVCQTASLPPEENFCF